MKPTSPAPVHYRVAPGGGLLFALAATLLALGAGLSAWLLALRQAQQTGVVAIGLATAMLYGGACWLSWRTMRALPRGWLIWTGKVWRLQPEQAEEVLDAGSTPPIVAEYPCCTLALDMQQAVLLRLHGAPGQEKQGQPRPKACWVWASRPSGDTPNHASDNKSWHALRCALVWAHAGHVGHAVVGGDGVQARATTGAASAAPHQSGAAS